MNDLNVIDVESPETTEKTFSSIYSSRNIRRTSAQVLGLHSYEWAVLAMYTSIAMLTIKFHEPWADEAQAWLIARDLPFNKMLLQVGHEGTPPLWHILLWFACRAHLPYSHIGLISATVMTGAIYIWLRYAPLPAWLRLLAPFTFFLEYQHAVVARSYCLTNLLAFASVAIWRSKKRSFVSVGLLLAFMCQTNFFGFVLTGALMAYFWLELVFLDRRSYSRRQHIEFWIVTVMVIVSACLGACLAAPPPDVDFPRLTSITKAPMAFWWPMFAIRIRLVFLETFGTSSWGILLSLTLLAWLAESKRRLCIVPYLGVFLVATALYSKPWHLGMIVVALLVTIWLAWSEQVTTDNRTWTYIFAVILFFTFLIQIRWTIVSVRRDIREPYSGAKATAEYLRPLIGKRHLYGANYHSIGILPYFDHNIFMNQPSHSYWAWSVNDTSDSSMLMRRFPERSTVVLSWELKLNRDRDPIAPVLKAQQFRLTHTFCGHLFMRDVYSELSCYDIYEKN